MIYNSIVNSVPIYRAENWSLYENDSRNNATEMAALRRSARISKLVRKTTEYLKKKKKKIKIG